MPDRDGIIGILMEISGQLGELKTGQILNRKIGQQAVEALGDHMESKFADLTDRVDRLEDRQEAAERDRARSAKAADAKPAPTLRDVLPVKELIGLALLLAASVVGLATPETVQRGILAAVGSK